MSDELNKLAFWCKTKEIAAIDSARMNVDNANYWGGKAQAFSEVWERIVFSGEAPTPQAYNRENDEWSALVNDAREG